jgi:glucarate dehydratase
LSTLRIEGARLTRLAVRLRFPYVSSQVPTGRDVIYRTIIRLYGSDGRIGLGETVGSPGNFAVCTRLCEGLIGADPFDLNRRRRRFAPLPFSNMDGRNGWMAYGGVEAACFDLIGRHLNVPLFELLGGRHTERVKTAAVMGAYPIEQPVTVEELEAFFADLANVEVVVAKAKELIEDGGYDSLKIKSAGISPAWDAAVLRALREAFGPALNLRLDANGGFTPVEALRLGRAIEDLDLEYLEDPVAGIDAMARLRRDLRTPFATNMCIIDFDQLPVGIRAGAADIVLGDIFHWGGVQAFRELAAVCGAFRLGMGMHSFWEMGLATALNLHLAAAHAQVDHAIDGILWLYPDDITAGPRMVVQGGALPVPDGPGVGVELDEDKVARYRIEEKTLGAAGE